MCLIQNRSMFERTTSYDAYILPAPRDLVEEVAPFAIGMANSIEDVDAINYAAQFYAAIANGQSIASAHASGQAALELAGLDRADVPTLTWADDVNPRVLVKPPETL